MHKLTSFLLTIILAVTAHAKDTSISQIAVTYNYHHYHFFSYEYNHPMILLANSTESKFYNRRTELYDSLRSTPEGTQTYYQMRKLARNNLELSKSLPSNSIPLYIFKKKGGETTVYDGFVSMAMTYSEKYETQQWNICDTTKSILGYECIMAETDWRGRHWTAWFTPDIPIHDGPWKLCGLPGLILEASESQRQHTFTAYEIEMLKKEMLPHPNPKEYQKKKDRMDLNRSLREWQDRLPYGAKLPDGRPAIEEYRKDLDYLETDYR